MTRAGELRVACANLDYGGIGKHGSRARLDKTLAVLRDWEPHAVLLQEVAAGRNPQLSAPMWDLPRDEREERLRELRGEAEAAARRHLRSLAGELGLPVLRGEVLGPPTPMAVGGLHPAILIRDSPGAVVEVAETGPPSSAAGGLDPAWCHVALRIRGTGCLLDLYSAHLPARSAIAQLLQAQWLASCAAQRGNLVIAGGDWNSFARADGLTEAQLKAMPPHLRPARMRCEPGERQPDYGVHDALADAGLVDAAARLASARRDPENLTGTGRYGGRVDRFHVTEELLPAVTGYHQRATGGSDHQVLLLTVALAALRKCRPRGPAE